MRKAQYQTVPADAVWLSKFELDRLGKMTLEEFEKMSYMECSIMFTEGGGRDVCRLIWLIVHGKNKK